MTFQEGQIVISKSGHDTMESYIILSVQDEYVYLVNGTTKTIAKPKKKNMKHIQPLKYVSDEFSSLKKEGKLTDEFVKALIRKLKTD